MIMLIRRVLYRNSTTLSNGSFYNTRDRLDPCNPEVFSSAPTNTNVFPWLFLEVVFSKRPQAAKKRVHVTWMFWNQNGHIFKLHWAFNFFSNEMPIVWVESSINFRLFSINRDVLLDALVYLPCLLVTVQVNLCNLSCAALLGSNPTSQLLVLQHGF